MFSRPKFFVMITVVLMITMFAGGCSETKTENGQAENGPRYGGALRANLSAPVQTMDPAHLYDMSSIEVAKEVFNGLVTIDSETMEVIPAHAQRWESKDDRIFTFQLSKGIKFHNGQEVTAEDFKFSLERILDPATASEISGMLMPIKGAKEKLEGKTGQVTGIRVKDNYTLEIELNAAVPGFLHVLSHPGFSVVCQEAVESAGADFGTQASINSLVGSGPFKVSAWDNSQIELTANESYFRGKPFLEKAIYRFIKEESTALNEFRAGNLDIVDRIPPGQMESVAKEFPGQLMTTNLLGVNMYLFNMEQPPFNNLDIRKAVNYAINRDDIVLALGGEAVEGNRFVPDGIPDFDVHLKGYGYDKKKAAEFLEKAGYPGGKGLPRIELKYNSSEVNQLVAEIIQANLREVGIETVLISLEPAAFLEDLSAGKTQMFRISWVADYPDVETFLAPLFASTEMDTTNFGRYKNESFDQLLQKARLTKERKKRAELYEQAHQLLLEDCVGTVLYYPAHTILYSPKVKGLQINKLDMKPLHKVWLAE